MTGGGDQGESSTSSTTVDEDAVGRPNLIDETQDQANDTESEPEIVEIIEYVTIKKPSPVGPVTPEEVSKEVLRKRKKQYGITALTGIGALTIIVYLVGIWCKKLRIKAQYQRQVLAHEADHTIEVGRFNDIEDMKSSGKRPGLKVEDGYEASNSKDPESE